MAKQSGLSKVADKYLSRLEQADKLRALANRNNYSYKVKQLTDKIQKEYNFWSVKDSPERLADLTRDLIFIKSQYESFQDKEKIDILMQKYGLK